MCCATTADFVKVSESSYPMCSVCNQTKERIKEDCELSHLFCGCLILHCNDMSVFFKRALIRACVFCKVYVFARLLKLLAIPFNFKVMINDKVIKHHLNLWQQVQYRID